MKKKTAAQIAWENAKSSDAYRLRTSQGVAQERPSTRMTGAQAAWNSAKSSSGYIQRAAQQTVKTPTTTPKIEISTTAKTSTGRTNGQSQRERQERLAGRQEAYRMQQESGIIPGAKKETQKAETKNSGVTNLGGLSRYTNRKESQTQELEGPRGTLNRYIQKPESDNRPEKKQARIQKPTAEHYDAEQIRQYKEQEIGDYKKVLDEQNALAQERYATFQTAEKAVQDAQTAYEKNPNGVTRMQYLKAYNAYQKAWEPVQEAAKRSEELTNEVNSLLTAYQTEYDDATHFAGKDYAGMQAYITELADQLDQTGEDEKNAETGQKLRQQYQEEIDRAQAYSYSMMDKAQLQAEYDSLTEAARAAARSEKTGPVGISDSGLPVFGQDSSNEALDRINEKKRLVQKAMDQLELREARDAYETYAEGKSLSDNKGKNAERPTYDLAGQNLIDAFEKIVNGEKIAKNAGSTTEIALHDQIQRNMEYLPENAKKIMLQFLTDKDYVSAANYYKAYEQIMTANYAENQYSELKNWAAQNFGTALAGSVGAGVVGSVAPAAAWIDNTFNAINNKIVDVSGEGQYRFSDINGDMYRGARTSAALQEGVQEFNATTGEWEGALNLASGALTSSVQNVLQFALFGAASLPVMAASAAGQSTYQGLKSGLSEEQTAVTSTVSGLIEYMTEKLPLEHLLDKINKISDGGVVTVKQIAEMVRKQGLEEASEEVVGNIADNLFDLFYNGDNSEYRQYSAQLQREGISKAEADMEAFGKFFIGDSVEAAAAAYLSTILLIGGNVVSANLQAAQYGKDMKSGEKFKGTQYTNEEMQTLLFSQQIPEGYEGGRYAAEQLIEQFRHNRELSNRMLGFAAAANNQVMTDAGAAINEALGMGPDTQSYKMADAMMRQYEAGNQLPSKAFLETLKSQVEQDKAAPRARTQRAQTEDGVTLSHYQTFLVQNGVGVRDAQNRTEVMNKLILGQSVSDAELRKMHIGAKLTKQMLYELTGVEIPEGITKEKDLMRYYRSAREGFEAKIRAEAQERTAQDVQATAERQQAYMAEQLRQEDIANRVVEATKTDIDEQLQYFLEHGKLKENAPTAQEGATEHGTEGGETVLRGAGGWVDGQSDGETDAAAARNAEADAGGTRGADRGVDAGVSEEVPQGVKGRGRAVSSRDFGLKNSTTLKTAREVLREDESAQMRKFREDVNAKYGYDVVYTDGDFVQRQDGRDVIVRGLFEPETRRIFVNANYFRLNYDQIGNHEVFHIEVANGDVDLIRMAEAFNAATGNAEILDSLVQQYMEKLSIADHDAALEEVFADMNGGFNGIRSVNVMAYQDIFTQIKAASPELGEAASFTEKSNTKEPLRYSLSEYSENQITNWANSKKILVYESEQQLIEFVNKSLTDQSYTKKMYFGTVGEALAEHIMDATGFDFEGLNVTLRADNVRKIFSDHGESAVEEPRGQRAVTDKDFLNIPEVIGASDTLTSGTYKGRPAAEFKKTINGSKITVFAVASGKSSLDLFVQTMYAGKQKGNVADLSAEKTTDNTPKASVGTAPTSTVAQSAETVKQKNSTEVDADTRKAHDKEALSYFGKTYRWNETGYVLLDGSKLDFSGRHEGGPGGYRTVDHRDIIDALGENYGGGDYSGGMVQFMQEGNIRISPESGGINLAVMPTKAQMDALSDFISRERGEVLLDIDDANGNTISSTEYPRGTHANRILQDIRNYFQNGVMPEVSQAPTVSQFRYSQEVDDVTESKQFKEWFGDWQNHPETASKVVNADGTPKIVYHGTNADKAFTVFDTYGGRFGLFGVGSYFTENKEVAESYTKKGKGNNPRVYSAFLNIRNPLDMDAKFERNAWAGVLDAEQMEYARDAKTNEDLFRALKEYCQDYDMRQYEAEELIEGVIEGAGYDGITHVGGGRYGSKDGPKHQVYIAFNPEQIKSATDNAGTFDRNNPDIRYSVSEEADEEYRRLAENPDENRAELQRMVDAAANAAGYTKKAYHGTDNDFWTFSLRNRGTNGEMLGVGYYFAEDRTAAENYARGGGKVLPVYLDIQNPVSATKLTITPERWSAFLDYAQAHRDEYIDGAWKGNSINKDFELRYMNDYDSDTDLISGFINATAGRNAGVAEAYLEMLRDSTGLDGVVQRENGSQVYVAFTPEQIKSAETVTRNDDGAVILLRERFDSAKGDIRYSQDVDGISETGYTDETTDEEVNGNGREYSKTRSQDSQRNGRNSDRIGTGRSHGPIAKAERIGWDGIDEASRQRIRKTFGEFFDHKVKDEAFLIYDYLEQKAGSTDGAMAEFAKQLYDTMWDGDVVFENRWGGAFEDVDGLLTAIEDAAGYRNERYSPKYSVDTDLMDVWQEQNPGQTEVTQEGFDTARRTLLDRYQNDTVLRNAYDSVGAAKNGNDTQEKVSQVRTNTFEKLFSEAEKNMDGLKADDMKYDVIREKESLEGAKARLTQDFDGEVADLLKRTDWTGEDLDTAMGALAVFREEAQRSGDYSKVIELAQKIRENGTKGGQFVQAFAKYNRATPEGLLVKAIDEVEKARHPVQKKNVNPAMQAMIDSYTEQIRDLRAEQNQAIQDAKLAGQMGQGKADAAELRKLRERYEEQIRQLNEQRDKLLADALQAGRDSQKKADNAAMKRITDAYNKRIEQWQKKIDLAKAAYDELFQKGQAQQQQTDARAQERKIQSYEEMLADLMSERDEILNGGLDALRAKNKGISDAKAQEITKNLTEMADALDAVKEGDVEALIDVIQRQGEIRKTPVSNATLNNLRKQNFEWLWSAASTQYLQIAKDYVKPSIAKRVSTFQTLSHLFNMRTGARNVVSNLAFSVVEAFANDVSAIPDMILGVFTGKRGVNFDAAIFSRENWQGFMEGYSKVQPELALDIETAEGGKYGTGRRTNKMTGNVLTQNLSRLERLMGYELNLTDEVTKGSIRAETLRQLQGFVDSGKMTMEEAAQAAEREMLYRTFQDDTLVGTTLSQLKKLGNLVGFGDSGQKIGKLTVHEFGLGDILTKYTQVPGALVHRAIEFTPAGYAKFLFDMAKIAKNGGVKNMSALQQRNLALAIGRATTGTGLIALFAALTRKGIILNADDEDDPDAKALRAAGGISGTQINIDALGRLIRGEDAALRDGDELWGVEFMQPINGAMTIGALLNRSEEGRNLAQKWLDAIVSGTAQSIDDLSVMNTLQTIQNALEYSQEDSAAGKAKDIVLELAKSSISGFVPSPIRQAAQGMDPYYRDAYGSKNVLTQGKEQIMNAVPWLRQKLPTKLTNFGEDKTYGGDAVQRWMNAFFTPGSVRTYQADETVQELLDLYYASGDADIIPAKSAPYKIQIGNERYDMSAAERRAYQTEMGQTAKLWMDQFFNSDAYSGMTTEERAAQAATIVKAAKDVAKNKVAEDMGIDSAKVFDSDITVETTRLGLAGEAGVAPSLPDSKSFSDPSRTGYKYELTNEELQQWQDLYNDAYTEAVGTVIQSDSYVNADDAEKADMIRSAKESAKDSAKDEFLTALEQAGIRASLDEDSDLYEIRKNVTSGKSIDSVVKRMKSDGVSENSISSAITSTIKDGYLNGDFTEKNANQKLVQYGAAKDADDAYWKIREWEGGEDYKKYDQFFDAVEDGMTLDDTIAYYTEHGVEEKTLKSQITSHYKPLYLAAGASERQYMKTYLVDAYVALGKSRSEASRDIDKWLEQ